MLIITGTGANSNYGNSSMCSEKQRVIKLQENRTDNNGDNQKIKEMKEKAAQRKGDNHRSLFTFLYVVRTNKLFRTMMESTIKSTKTREEHGGTVRTGAEQN